MLSVETRPRRETKPRRRLTAEQRRESILVAAVEVFTASGYRAGKVADVAARVGVSEPVVFQNFGSKAALFAAVVDRVAGEAHAELQGLVEQFGSVPDLLAHILDLPHRPLPHRGRPHAALFADVITMTAEPELPEAAHRAIRAVARHLADLLRRGQAAGEIRAEVDPDAAAWLLLSIRSARPFRATAMPDPTVERAVAALAVDALTRR